jgi:uncharacterized protein YbjT (DUF2867 family)
VAGATGYLGRYVVKEFKERGDWVRVLARNPEKLKVPGEFLEPAVAELADEVYVGEVTRPETLGGLCEGIDIVFSSVGITRQTDRVSYMDVDYQGNKNLLDLAVAASARKFIFVHVFQAQRFPHLENMRAKQRFADELKQTDIGRAIVLPTGFFSDMSEFLAMARRGTVYLIGQGNHKLNPIHGADLAKVCVDATSASELEIPAGGPITYTYREIAELAFESLGKPPRIRRIPLWLIRGALPILSLFSKRYYTIAAGITTLAQDDFEAPRFGTHTLKDFFKKLVQKPRDVSA